MEDNVFYSKFIDLEVNLIQKYFKEIFRIVFNQISGYHYPNKLIHKMNRHK